MSEVILYRLIPELSDSDIKRFWSKVAIVADVEKCWQWLGSTRRKGYGSFNLTIEKNNDKAFSSHRISYFIHNKVDPKDKVVMHLCDNTGCVNPYHLRVGTNEENTEDMMIKQRGKEQFGKGVNHSQSRLTDRDVISIRETYSKGGTKQKDLAQNYKVDGALISRIINRKLWKHI